MVVNPRNESAPSTVPLGRCGPVLLTAALGMLIAISLWWVYFDFVSHHRPLEGLRTTYTWVYLHLPLTASITAAGAAVLNVVEHSGEHLPAEVRGLLVGAIAVALITISLLMRIIHLPPSHHEIVQTGSRVTFVVAIIVALLGFSSLETIPL
ncbi:MAG: low temperature requirement protein A, partial [Ardenticatenaceae bacterium]